MINLLPWGNISCALEKDVYSTVVGYTIAQKSLGQFGTHIIYIFLIFLSVLYIFASFLWSSVIRHKHLWLVDIPDDWHFSLWNVPFIFGNTPRLEVYLFDINVAAQAFPVFAVFSVYIILYISYVLCLFIP